MRGLILARVLGIDSVNFLGLRHFSMKVVEGDKIFAQEKRSNDLIILSHEGIELKRF